MTMVIFIAKLCVVVFFGVIFIGNLIGLAGPKIRGQVGSDLYLEKQLWMVVSLLAIAIVLGNL